MSCKKTFVLLLMFVFTSVCFGKNVTFRFSDGTSGVAGNMVVNKMERNLSELLTSIDFAAEKGSPKVEIRSSGITYQALSEINKLWSKVKFRVVDSNCVGHCLLHKNKGVLSGYQARNIAIEMLPTDPSEWEDDLKQEICIDFDKEGNITYFTLSIEWEQINKMLQYGTLETEDADMRLRVIDFCDQLKTAYCNKDIETLRMRYDPHSLIVVGRQISTGATFTKLSGEQYLRNLEQQFKNTKEIAVEFRDYQVLRHYDESQPIYVATFRQDWFTKNKNDKVYKDLGYVCLVWDFSDPDKPTIHFRSWQPIETAEKHIINMYHKEVQTIINK